MLRADGMSMKLLKSQQAISVSKWLVSNPLQLKYQTNI